MTCTESVTRMPNDIFETFFSSFEPIPFDPQASNDCVAPIGHQDVKCILDAVDTLLRTDILPDDGFNPSSNDFHEEDTLDLFSQDDGLMNLLMASPLQAPEQKRRNSDFAVTPCAKKPRIGIEQDLSHNLSDTESSASSSVATSTSPGGRFRECQEGQWYERYQELVNFHQERGHSMVPHNWHENPRLAQWVKRQRYQYRLKQQGKNSTITADREEALNRLGFVWDSHTTTWDQRFNELLAFKATHGHCRVPTNYQLNQSLAIWVKCQRRQHALFFSNSASTMTLERLSRLTEVGFDFNPRNLSRRAMI